MDDHPLLALSPVASSSGSFPLLPTDFRRLVALPDRKMPPARSPSSCSSSSISSLGTVASAIAASDFQDGEGLSADDTDGNLARRAEWFGVNYVAPPPARGLLRLMAEAVFMDTTNLILVIDGVVAVALGMAVGGHPSTDWMEGTCVLIAVLAIAIAIAIVTAVGDFQKERQQESERSDNSGDSHVRKWSLVVGDIVQLEPGDVVPAYGLAFNTRELKLHTGQWNLNSSHWKMHLRWNV
ncbi:hypothetical protein PF008_g13004 [Phytophthora fragariae]|uniref:Cation-transporting P-type ATPase N-terminal domain-containing protein n=1 Tax=Phytophthora fragariae TaxID=53985 RepID=A0A6G0RL68_9STRA|nr:hypothetical protein PF008_g13004 [Phytophthora fragariae]